MKIGDHVRWLCPYGYYVYGEITIVRGDGYAKVLFSGNEDWDYDYYKIDDLEIINPENLKDTE